MTMDFRLALDPPGSTTLTYYEVAGVISSIVPYMRRWSSSSPASAKLELWRWKGTVLEQRGSGYIRGFWRPRRGHCCNGTVL